MALVTTTVTPEVRVTPFTGISETVRERSGIARAEVVYSAYGNWPATGVGDNRSISFLFNLNPNYGYVMMDCNAVFIKASAHMAMEATGVMEIATSTGPGATQNESQWYQFENLPARQDASGSTEMKDLQADDYNSIFPITGGNSAMAFTLVNKPTALLYPFPGIDDLTVVSMFGESATARIIMAYRFYCRFLEYDITQGYNYVVNSPFLTR